MAKSMCGKELLPPSALLKLTGVEQGDSGSTIMANGPDREACPQCNQISHSRHSRYVRTLKDLPAFGVPVSRKVRVN